MNPNNSTKAKEQESAIQLPIFFMVVTFVFVLGASFLVKKWSTAKIGTILQFIGVSFLFLESFLKNWINPESDLSTIFENIKRANESQKINLDEPSEGDFIKIYGSINKMVGFILSII